jgi:hypothetical protein
MLQSEESPCQPQAVHTWSKADTTVRGFDVAYKCAELTKEMRFNARISDASCAAMRQFEKSLRFRAQGTAHQTPKERTESEEAANITWFFDLGRSR